MDSYPTNDRLREVRTKRKYSRQRLAQLLGVRAQVIARWELRNERPDPATLAKLCTLLHAHPEELGFFSEPSRETQAPQWYASPLLVRPRRPVYDPALPLLSPTPLIGRQLLLATIKAMLWLKGERRTALALNGMPGIGKTAIATTLAYDTEVRNYFSAGVLWAGLGHHPNLRGTLSRWALLLGLPYGEMTRLESIEALANSVHALIGTHPFLLVLDDVWRMEDALALAVGGSTCTHVITTRFPPLAATFAGQGAIAVQELGKEDSLLLLCHLAPAAVENELLKVQELLQTVGGLPLALTLLGNYLRMQSYSGQNRRTAATLNDLLADAQARLRVSELRGSNDQHPSLPVGLPVSLQSILTVADQHLGERSRVALYALSVLPPKPDSFSEEAALAIAACPEEILDQLVDAGLIEVNGRGRYTIHQVIADYARAHLQDDARERLLVYSTAYIREHQHHYEQLEQESATLLVALDMAYTSNSWKALVDGSCAFTPYLLARGLYALAERHLQRAHHASLLLEDPHGLMSTLFHLGETVSQQGKFAQAERYFQEGLALGRQVGAHDQMCAFLSVLGHLAWKRGEYTQAETYLQEGLILARQDPEHTHLDRILKVLGFVAEVSGAYARSTAYLREGLALARASGEQEHIASILLNLGITIAEQGQYQEAEQYFQEGLEITRSIGHFELTCALLNNLGETARIQQHYSQAERYLQEGLALARSIEHSEWTGVLLLSLGQTSAEQGLVEQAEGYLQASLPIARHLDIPRLIGHVLYEYGNLELSQQRLARAEEHFQEMLLGAPQESQEVLALAQYGLARVSAAQGHTQEARTFGESSATVLEQIGHHEAQAVKQWLASLP